MMPEYEDTVYWIWMQKVFGCGSHRPNALLSRFETAREIYSMTQEELIACKSFTDAEIYKLKNTPIESANAVAQRCSVLGCCVITPQDTAYPERMRNIYAMPLVLYVRGDLTDLDHQLAVTMVGTRKATAYGLEMGELLGRQLARYGAVVISGGALGIDTACLKGAIRGGGKTVVMLGGGIDVMYPRENTKMFEWIAQHHALVTEYPPGSEPKGAHFPIRNRILSGLSLGTVVVEGKRGSGALITATHALEQGKDVFAVPGKVTDMGAQGPLDLLRQGAKMCCHALDILSEYEHLFPADLKAIYDEQLHIQTQRKSPSAHTAEKQRPVQRAVEPPAGLEPKQQALFLCMSTKAQRVEQLSSQMGMGMGELLPLLTELEILGLICSKSIGQYAVKTLEM